MPNIFTPNGDLYNETFHPKSSNYIAYGKIHIYNRWGKEIFSGDMFEGWDGKEHGIEASTGIYFYQIAFSDPKGRRHIRKGTLTLTR